MRNVPERYFDKKHKPQPLREVLADYLQTSGLSRLLGHPELYAAWREAVGEDLAAHSRVSGFRGGILEVEVDSSVLLHRMAGFQKHSILKTVRDKNIGVFVQDIKFKIGTF